MTLIRNKKKKLGVPYRKPTNSPIVVGKESFYHRILDRPLHSKTEHSKTGKKELFQIQVRNVSIAASSDFPSCNC